MKGFNPDVYTDRLERKHNSGEFEDMVESLLERWEVVRDEAIEEALKDNFTEEEIVVIKEYN